MLDGLDFAVEPRARVAASSARTAPGSRRSSACWPGSRSPTRGTAVRRRGITVSYLPQHPLGDERTPLEVVRAARPDLAELDRELHRVAEQLGSPELAADLDRMARMLRTQEELVERWEGAGGPSLDGRARAMLLDVGIEEADLAPAHVRALRRPAEADRARGLPRAGAGRAPARRAGGAPGRRRALAARAAGGELRRRRRRRLARPLSARRDREPDRLARPGQRPGVAGQLLGVHARTGARTGPPAAGRT